MTGSGGQPEKKKKGVPKKPLIIVAAVLVLIVGFGAVLSLFEGDSEPDSDSEGSNGLDWVEKFLLCLWIMNFLAMRRLNFLQNIGIRLLILK